MKNYLLFLFPLLSIILSCKSESKSKQDDWQILFNGEDLKNWIVKIHHHEMGDNDQKIRLSYEQGSMGELLIVVM